MAADTDSPLHIKILSVDRLVFEGEGQYVVARSTEGDLGVHPGHEALVTPLDITALRLQPGDGAEAELQFAVHRGYLRVRDNDVLILADSAEASDEIDAPRAKQARDRARSHLAGESANVDLLRAEMALRRALVRLQIKGES